MNQEKSMTNRTLYEAGWHDCVDYYRDSRNLRDKQAGGGILLVLLGSIILAMPVGVLILTFILSISPAQFNVTACVIAGIIGSSLIGSGFWLDKRRKMRYAEYERSHYQKWNARWQALGINGDVQ